MLLLWCKLLWEILFSADFTEWSQGCWDKPRLLKSTGPEYGGKEKKQKVRIKEKERIEVSSVLIYAHQFVAVWVFSFHSQSWDGLGMFWATWIFIWFWLACFKAENKCHIRIDFVFRMVVILQKHLIYDILVVRNNKVGRQTLKNHAGKLCIAHVSVWRVGY